MSCASEMLEAVNSVLKFEEDGDRDLCSKPREIQLIAQPLAGVTPAFVETLSGNDLLTRVDGFLCRHWDPQEKVKFLDQICSQCSQVQ